MDEEDAQLVRTWGELPELRLRAARLHRAGLAARLDRHGQGRPAVRLPVRLPDRRRRAGRDGAVPVRHRQADPQGLPARAAAGAGQRAGHVRHRLPAHRGVEPLPPGEGRPLPDRHLRGGAGRDPRRGAAGGERAARQVRGVHDQLPARGRGGGQGHQGHVPGAPVRQGRDVRLLPARAVPGVPRRAALLRGGDRPGAGHALPGHEHLRRRPRRARGQEVRHRGLVPGPAALPGDHLLLEHHRLPGPAAQHPVPPRRQAGVPAHPQRHRGDRAGAAVDHGELPGRARHGRRPRGAARVRRPGHDRGRRPRPDSASPSTRVSSAGPSGTPRPVHASQPGPAL